MIAKIHPNQKIHSTLLNLSRSDQIIGHIINHIPKIAHMIQKFFFFVSGSGEISVRIACKMEIFHPVIQFINLDMINIQYCCVARSIKYDIAVQITHRISGCFLPNLSEICHKTGAARNANSE
jgi:hypothetical protein